jgi:hypothetical protein
MSELEWRRIRVDWEELEDAFADGSAEHRYYLDRETGAVHFFSSYLDNEEEEEDERAMTGESRYVLIPNSRRLVSLRDLEAFIGSLERESERRVLASSIRAPESQRRFEEALSRLPNARGQWRRFLQERLDQRIKSWLTDVAVEPID